MVFIPAGKVSKLAFAHLDETKSKCLLGFSCKKHWRCHANLLLDQTCPLTSAPITCVCKFIAATSHLFAWTSNYAMDQAAQPSFPTWLLLCSRFGYCDKCLNTFLLASCVACLKTVSQSIQSVSLAFPLSHQWNEGQRGLTRKLIHEVRENLRAQNKVSEAN